MASVSCQTAQWVNTSPYVKLLVSEVSSSETTTTLAYTLYYIASSAANTSAAKSYTIKIGDWSTSGTCNINGFVGQGIITTDTRVIEKTKVSRNIPCSCTFGFELTWSGVYCGAKTASTVITIDAITSYQVTYNANGGTGAPSAQKKWQGETLTLSSTKPTRTGYTFQGWGTSAADTTVDYKPGASYTANAAITLYAIWKANTYAVTYNANGGTGEPAAQTKTHGVSLTLTTSKPTKPNYTFKGWATTATGDVSYQPGGTYTGNAALTLYAVWESSYVLPILYNVSFSWADNLESTTDSNGVVSKCIYYFWEWKTTYENPRFVVTFIAPDGTVEEEFTTGTQSTSGDFAGNSDDAFRLRTDKSYTIKLTATDAGGSTTVTTILPGDTYPIDVLAEGKGISFGGPASLEDTAHFQWAVRFDKPVHGMVRGLGKLPKIEAGSDFNDYMDFGAWAVYGNADSLEINNMPPLYSNSDVMVGRAGILEVYSPTGEGMRSAEWSYIRQRFIPYSLSFPIMERDITRNASNVWNYGNWYKTSETFGTLYDNASGSTGTITLSQNASNYKYLEIFFTDNNGELGGYTKIHAPYTKVVNLSIIEAGGTSTYIRRTSYSISGNTITPDVTNAGYARLSGTELTHTFGTNYIKITRIVGRNS